MTSGIFQINSEVHKIIIKVLKTLNKISDMHHYKNVALTLSILLEQIETILQFTGRHLIINLPRALIFSAISIFQLQTI